jgi:hypothetical protein
VQEQDPLIHELLSNQSSGLTSFREQPIGGICSMRSRHLTELREFGCPAERYVSWNILCILISLSPRALNLQCYFSLRKKLGLLRFAVVLKDWGRTAGGFNRSNRRQRVNAIGYQNMFE